ncbi:hypothetical protein ACI65C_009837 [Semiaphis heraclei]
MSDTQMHLHSENFDLCRICLLEPESNRHIKFIHIFNHSDGELNMCQQISELLGVKVEKDDIKPKLICETCHSLLITFNEAKKKAAESQIVINYIATKKFGVTIPGTSNTSYSSPDSRNKEEFTKKSSSFTNSSSIKRHSNTNKYNINGCSSSCSSSNSNNKQGGSSRSFITNHSKSATVDSESDDDDTSCLEIKEPVEVIDLLSSDSEETSKINFKNEFINEVEKLYYCSICQKKNILNHDCSQYNKSFFTCLVPNCNILSRSRKDFTPHYRRHIGLSSTAVMCRRCYQEVKKADRDVSGHYHIRCHSVNLFKCYACHVVFNTMEEFAYHKLKSHNGRLMNSYGNYLCFYCEQSAPDLTTIIEHTKHCFEKQKKNVTEFSMKLKENKTELLPVKKSSTKNVLERKRNNVIKIPRSSTHLLFTCLKPSCNLIFPNFSVFKFHHREHFELGNTLMCWQCCVPMISLNSLRAHQVQGNCRTPGLFKCYQCSEQFDDLQSLSIHKFTIHDGELLTNKKTNKSLICAYCNKGILIDNFKSHLITCQYSNVEKHLIIKPKLAKPKSTYTKKYKSPYKCSICNKVCLTAAALSSHIKIHNPSPKKKIVKKRMSTTSSKTEYLEIINSDVKRETDAIESINNDMSNTGENNEIDVEMNTLSDNYLSNETMESGTSDSYLLKCKNCPKKFKSNSGMAKHSQHCDNKNTLKSKPQNYYCTKCKKYFTRLTFFQHWRVHHGKRLPYHKYKRYACKQCPFKFIYQIALTMHIEHVHGVQDNNVAVTSNMTPIDCVEMLPVISETTSLANNIPETTSMANNIPETTSMANNIPETTLANNIPETTSMANNIPETIVENNKEFNIQIKQEANANTSFDQWEVFDNGIKENIIEHNTNEGNNEVSDLKNNDEPDVSNNNDNGENETDVYTAQSINQIINQLNDTETIEELFYDEDTIVVNNAYSMDISECSNNYIDKAIAKNETNLLSSVIEGEKQNCLDGELVALNDTENVKHVNENKINNSVLVLPSSDE